MAILKKIHNAKGTTTTTDAVTWVTIASYTIAVNCTVIIESWLVGKDASGNVATAKGIQPSKRVSGTPSLVGTLINLLTFAQGSDVVLATSDYRLQYTGDLLELQVKGIAATTIEWMGGFEIKIN